MRRCGNFRGMKTISVSELHERTADWVQAVRTEAVLIADGGNPVARLEPWPGGSGQTLRERKLRPGFARLAGRVGPKSQADDVTRFIAEEREGR
jgi:antitoxin (DNA-binding transcriptional repressor) of toxin-antitoxin stability system